VNCTRAKFIEFVSLSKRSTIRENEFLIAINGNIKAPKGKYDRNPATPAGGILSAKGML
jgi:hypothetical protein